VPVLVAAGVATALAFGGSSASPRLAITSSRPSATQTGTGSGAHAEDTAYIIRRVRAHLAQLAVAGEGQVLESVWSSGNGTADYPTVNTTDWVYIDPQSGVAYQRSVDSSADGTNLMTNALVTTAAVG
jgi:hypothetical protein